MHINETVARCMGSTLLWLYNHRFGAIHPLRNNTVNLEHSRPPSQVLNKCGLGWRLLECRHTVASFTEVRPGIEAKYAVGFPSRPEIEAIIHANYV